MATSVKEPRKRAGKGAKTAADPAPAADPPATDPAPAPQPANSAPAPPATDPAPAAQPAAAKKRAGKGKGKAPGRGARKHAAEVVKAAVEQPQKVTAAVAAGSAKVFVEENAPDVAALLGAGSEVHFVKRNIRKRKRADPDASLARYRERMAAERGADEWASLAGAWLSDYGLYAADACPQHHVHTLMTMARERGAEPKGAVSENMKAGVYVQPMLPDGTPREGARVVYVGGQNKFTNRERSPWAMLPADKVMV